MPPGMTRRARWRSAASVECRDSFIRCPASVQGNAGRHVRTRAGGDHERVERIAAAATRQDEEGVDIDRLDLVDVRGRELREDDEGVSEGLDVRGLLSARTLEDCAALDLRDHAERLGLF